MTGAIKMSLALAAVLAIAAPVRSQEPVQAGPNRERYVVEGANSVGVGFRDAADL